MPRGERDRPKRLGAKLRQIRMGLGYSQFEMVKGLGAEGRMDRSMVSAWERGTKEPTLPMLLKYAKLGNTTTDYLIDDSVT